MSSNPIPAIDRMEPGRFLDWDSTFFGINIARIHSLDGARDWCAANRIVCAYFLADADEPEAVTLAEAEGFHLRDVRITLERPSPDAAETFECPLIREFQESDLPALVQIARHSHKDSRFYQDPHFDRQRCADFYETWIRRSCDGWASGVLVAEINRQAVGYLTCHLLVDHGGSIGLFAVDEASRGKGVGRQLVEASLTYFRDRSAPSIEVVTQGRNIRSQRLYQRCGFLPKSMQFWYHRWTP